MTHYESYCTLYNGRIENILVENDTLSSDLLMFCNMTPVMDQWRQLGDVGGFVWVGYYEKVRKITNLLISDSSISYNLNYESWIMSHTWMSHTWFESLQSNLITFEVKFNVWSPGGAREPIEKHMKLLCSAT